MASKCQIPFRPNRHKPGNLIKSENCNHTIKTVVWIVSDLFLFFPHLPAICWQRIALELRSNGLDLVGAGRQRYILGHNELIWQFLHFVFGLRYFC